MRVFIFKEISMATNYFLDQPLPSLQSFTPPTAATSNADQQGRFGDVVDAVQAGGLSALGGIFDFIGAQGIAQSLYGFSDDQYTQMSDRGREALSKQFVTEDEQGNFKLDEGAADLDTWLLTMANVAGQFAGTAVPGAGWASGAAKLASLGAKGKKIANAASMGFTGGAAATGQGMEQARQEIFAMPDEVKAASPLFQEILRGVHQAKPDVTNIQKWEAAEKALANQIANEVRSDPAVLIANFAASAIGDPIIGKALTGARISKNGALRSALAGFVTEGSTEAVQAGTQQYGINKVLANIDNRDTMQGVTAAALNEGLAGGGFGGVAGGFGGLINKQQPQTATQPNTTAEPGETENPPITEPSGAEQAPLATEPDPATEQVKQSNPVMGDALEIMDQHSTKVKRDVDNLEIPTIARQAGFNSQAEVSRFGELFTRPSQESLKNMRSQSVLDMINDAVNNLGPTPDDRFSPIKYQHVGELLSPEQSSEVSPFVRQTPRLENGAIDGEALEKHPIGLTQTRGITDKNIIFGQDNRPAQRAQAQVAQAKRDSQNLLPQKNIIFANDHTGVNVKRSGLAFQSEKEARSSKQARQAKRHGFNVRVVPFDNGFGWVIDNPPVETEPQLNPKATAELAGDPINDEWTAFSEQSGSKQIPRAQMPQIKAEHRGAMVQFLKGRDVTHEQLEVDAQSLKPTQLEFSPGKVQRAKEYEGGERSILVSNDGYVLDGHHQWLAAREKGEPVKVIKLDAPIDELIPLAHEFPSSEAEGAILQETEVESKDNDGTNAPLQSEQQERQQTESPVDAQATTTEVQGDKAANVQNREVERVSYSGNPVTTPEEAASAVASIRKKAQEQMTAVVTDGEGNVLNVVRHTLGTPNSASVSVGVLSGAILDTPNAKNVWFAHNHPSGKESQSDADRSVTRKLKELMDGSGVEVKGMLALGSSDKASFYDVVNDITDRKIQTQPAVRKAQAPVTERKIIKRDQIGDNIASPQEALATAKIVSDGRAGVLFLNQQNDPIKFEPLTYAEMAKLREGKLADILKNVHRTNAISAIIVTTDDAGVEGEARKGVENMSTMLEAAGLNVLDVIDAKAEDSLASRSRMPRTRATFYRSDSENAGDGVKLEDAKREFSVFIETYKGLNDEGFEPVITDKRPSDIFGPSVKADDNVIKGAYDKDTDTLFVFTQNHKGIPDIRRTLREELLVHKGLGVFEGQEISALLNAINKTRSSDNKQLQAYWKNVLKNYPDVGEIVQAEELLGKVAQEKPSLLGEHWNSILSALRTLLRKFNLVDEDISLPEMRMKVYEIGNALKKGQRAKNAGYNAQKAADSGLSFARDNDDIALFSKTKTNDQAKGVTKASAERVAEQFINSLKGANGINVHVLESTVDAEKLWRMNLEGTTVKGGYSDKTKTVYVIAENIENEADLKQTLAHETIAHGGLDTVFGAEAKKAFIDRIKATKGRKAFEQYWKDANKDYWDYNDDVKAEEIFARFVENEPSKGELKYWWQAFKRWLKAQLDKVGVMYREDDEITAMRDMLESIVKGFKAQREPLSNDQGSFVYSKETGLSEGDQYRKDLAKAMRSLRSNPQLITLGRTPEILRLLEAPDLSLKISRDTIRKATNGIKHVVGMEVIENLPEHLADPIAVFKSKTHGKVLLIDATDNNGNPIVAAVHFDKKAGRDLKINNIASVYGKENAASALKGFTLEYLNESKNPALVRLVGLQLSRSGSPSQGLSENVLTKADLVNENPDIRFSKTANADTRTAKEKLGLEAHAKQTLADKAKQRTNETVETLKSSSLWQRLNEGIFDGLIGIKQAEEAVGVTDPNKQGYVSARLAAGVSDVLHGVFNFGAPKWEGGIIQRKENTKGLLEVFAMLDDDLNNWLAWMGAHRAEKLKAQGRENNLTSQDIAELKSLAKGKEKLFEEVRGEYNKINSAILDVAQGAGLINTQQRKSFDEEYYVPFFRDMGETNPEMDAIKRSIVEPHTRKGIAGQSAQIKELKGSKQSTKDLLENIITRQSTLIEASLKNKAMQEVVANLDGTDYMAHEKSDDAKSMTQEELNRNSKVRVMINGEPQAYLVSDPSLLRALIQINDLGSQSLFNKMGRSAKRFLTAGITLSPDFIFKNFMRDAAHAWMINKDAFKFGTDSIKGLKKAFKEDEAYRDLIFSGAAFQGGYIHGADPEAAAQQTRRALRKKGLTNNEIDNYLESVINSGAELLEKYREISDKVENANRLSAYEAAVAAGKSKRQAAYEAKDLMDYSLKGNFKLIGTMIDMLPFFNARLQGMSKLVRAAKAGDKDRVLKVLSANLAMKGIKVAGLSLALAALNDEDERYQELPDWDKDANWHFFIGDDHWRIPKPFELGIIFGTIPERLLHFTTGAQTGKELRKSITHSVFNTLALNPIPQFALPVTEVLVNKSFFKDSPIEGISDKNKQAEDRYSPYTSDTVKALSQALGMSPKKIEHLIRGYTGTIGGYVLGLSDIVARQIMGVESADTPISRYPIIKSVYQGSGPKSNTKFVSDFYDAMDAANQAYGSYKQAMELGDTKRQKELINEEGDKLRARVNLSRIQRKITKLNKMQKTINDDRNLSGKEKRDRLDNITRQKNALYHQAYVTFKLGEW